jgi:hypothetical protein
MGIGKDDTRCQEESGFALLARRICEVLKQNGIESTPNHILAWVCMGGSGKSMRKISYLSLNEVADLAEAGDQDVIQCFREWFSGPNADSQWSLSESMRGEEL